MAQTGGSCNDMLNRMATDSSGSFTCGQRIVYLQGYEGKTEAQAYHQVAEEFPNVCVCDNPPQPGDESGCVCVFDIDGTTLNDVDTSLTTTAVETCRKNGHAMAVNTAEDDYYCQQNKPKLQQLGLYVPDPVYTCLQPNMDWGHSKTHNMDTIRQFYGTSKRCTLLFDDNSGNIHAVTSAGYGGQLVHTQQKGISPSELQQAMDKLDACDDPIPQVCYKKLKGMPQNEGNEVGKTTGGTLLDCETSCSNNPLCKSVAFTASWGGMCFLKDLTPNDQTPTHDDPDFSFYYQTDCSWQPNWYGIGKVNTVDFWGNMFGVGFSPADDRASQDWMKRDERSAKRMRDALQKASANGYNMIRTWRTEDYELLTMQTIMDLGIDMYVQLGVEIVTGESDDTAYAKIDKACEIASAFPDIILGLSLGNEQIGYHGMSTWRVINHVAYAKQACGAPVSYNFAETNFWYKDGAMDLVLSLDYVNVHMYGGFDTSLSPQQLFDRVKGQEEDRWEAFGKNVPMVIGETGYQVHYNGRTEAQKGQYYSLITKYIYGTPIENRKSRSMFWFELNNEDWKGNDDGWGIYNQGTADYIGNPEANFQPTKISDVLSQNLNQTRLIKREIASQ